MLKSELRKKIIRYSEILVEIKTIQVRTDQEKTNRNKEILALRQTIEKMKEELYGNRVDKR